MKKLMFIITALVILLFPVKASAQTTFEYVGPTYLKGTGVVLQPGQSFEIRKTVTQFSDSFASSTPEFNQYWNIHVFEFTDLLNIYENYSHTWSYSEDRPPYSNWRTEFTVNNICLTTSIFPQGRAFYVHGRTPASMGGTDRNKITNNDFVPHVYRVAFVPPTHNLETDLLGPYEINDAFADSVQVYNQRKQCNLPISHRLTADPVDTATGAHVIHRDLLQVNGAIPISFSVDFNSMLLKQGTLGNAWSHKYQVSLEQTGDNIIVNWNANQSNSFTLSGDNSFVSSDLAENDTVLIKNADATYTMKRRDQTMYNFDQSGRLTSEYDINGRVLLFGYNSSSQLNTIIEPISGQGLIIEYNNDGLIAKVSDNLARNVSFTYDTRHNLTVITDAEGKDVIYNYNDDRRILSAVTSPASITLITNTYDTQGRVETQKDALDQISSFNYDTASQPGKLITTLTDRNFNTKKYTYNDKNEQLSVQDELGNVTSFTYDNITGDRKTVTDARCNTTQYEYAQHNLTKIIDPLLRETNMTYDDRNNLLTVTNSEGKSITTSYDTLNLPISITDSLGNKTSFTYNANGQIETKTLPGQSSTIYNYSNGLLSSQSDPAGNTVSFGYDAVGRLTSTTDATLKASYMEYDNNDNLLRVTDPLGHSTSFTYGRNHLKLTQTDAIGNTTHFYYNSNDKLIRTVDALGNETKYEYDSEDRLIKTIDAKGYATNFALDATGKVVETINQLGTTTAMMQYDALGNLLSVKDALGVVVSTTSYDTMSLPISVTDALGRTVTRHYDNLYRLDQVFDAADRITNYTYDDSNRLVSVLDALNGISSQEFSPAGRLAAIIDPNQNRTEFKFDSSGRLQYEVTSSGTLGYAYNSRNLLSTLTNARTQSTTFDYFDDGRLSQLSDPTGTISYQYDPNGNLHTAGDSVGTLTREYDELNRVRSFTDANGKVIGYHYDNVSNLDVLTYPDGKTVSYEYYPDNKLKKVTDWVNRVTSYEYNANGALVKTTRPDLSVETQEYDVAGQLTQIKDVDKLGQVINQYDFTYDKVGNVTGETTNYQLLSSGVQNTTMTYGKDNRLETYNGQVVTYDADGNMITVPLAGTMNGFSYDSRNRLTTAGTTGYIYDAENRRIGMRENGNLTSYVINPTTLSQTLMKTDSQGNTTYYVYGLGLIGQELNGVYLNYHYDRRGSTIALTDMNGAVTDRWQYGAYAELVNHVGSTSTPFLYNGSDGVMTDSNGLYYMRARYYNPDIRRFVNRDVVQGSIDNGSSLNRFAYVNGNPVSFVDPFGLSPDSDNRTFGQRNWWVQLIPVVGLGETIGEGIGSLVSQYRYGTPFDTEEWSDRMDTSLASTTIVLDFIVIAKTSDKLAARLDKASEGSVKAGVKTDFYLTPKGDAVPATKSGLNDNLSKMTDKGGKYYGEGSNGLVRVRVEDAHINNPKIPKPSPDHDIPHIHVEYKQNGLTGQWGKGDPFNNISLPQSWFE